ncbi:ATP-binding cassette domain-containing protein [Microscilla marina]|uniref:Gliding motility protein n=1 Tax=Microscilla marina ATCC 23134 TaxID=313606 RepID=A2A099_MICM2|nr:ATP-binding cassette domain-containing protein [Microscilla marina]EAY23942.1 gliding motility protein [Microscilla marina ATCC 23134]
MDIKIEGVTKSYGNQKAVNDISFEVKTGEILGFLGPNGAGKTTTMKMITNYIAISQGDITIGGKSVKKHADDLKKHIGYLPEHNPLYLDMPVMDYLIFCAQLQGVAKKDLNKRLIDMIVLCGLDLEKHKKIGELSKGYRQRVGLAQAMIHDPQILILDEPTTGLDPNQIVEIRKLIRELGRAKTVILSTHILPEVEATCDRILIINRGNIVADGTAHSLRNKAQGQEVLKVKIEEAQAPEVLTNLKQLESVFSVTTLDEATNYFQLESQPEKSSKRNIFQLCVDKHWVLTEMTPVETRLEDIFRNLTMN